MTMRSVRLASLLSLLIAPLFAQSGDKAGEVQAPVPPNWKIPPSPVLSPAEQLKTFKLAPGFRAELVAAEPLVKDPVAMVFGPDGRLWVAEMTGYMLDVNGTGENDPIGSIVVLADTDGDGRMDQRSVFMDKLVLPRALALIDGGLLFATPPHVWFARDMDGDGKADSKVEVADDYGGPGNVEHLPNGLMWALDNWIYNANYTGRFRYEGGGKFIKETTISRGQWGVTQDNVGRIYYNSNSDPLRVDVVPSAYYKRNPNLVSRAGTNVQVAPGNLPVWPGRITPGVNRGYRTLRPDGTLPAVTAACSPVIYRGTLFPAEFQGNAFICEASVNLVKRIVVTEADGDLRGANAYPNTEFLTSTDERFRPVSAYNGPDGGLWLVDMYRGLIQHKVYVTSYLRKQVEERGLAQPTGLGRIWRVVPDSAPKANLKLTLAQASPLELTQALADPNGWTRDTAQRLLVEKRSSGAAAAASSALRTMAVSSENPLGRLHALWTLDGLGLIDPAIVLRGLEDRDVRVCAAAVRLAEKFLKPKVDEAILARLQALATRTEPTLRLQLALSLGEARTPAADATLRALLVAAGKQPYIVEAVVSGLAGREDLFVEALAREAKESAGAQKAAVVTATQAVMQSSSVARIARVLAVAEDGTAPSWIRQAVLDGVERFLPKLSDGKVLAANLTAEPKPLVALAAQKGPEAVKAKKLLASIRWPGKPGMALPEPVKLSAEEQAWFDMGKQQFAALCAACHQPEGQGLAGLAPPLVNSRWAVGDERITARIVLVGKAQENLIMPGLRAVLDDNAISAVLTYVRNSWGHTAGPISPAVVAAARKATAAREEPWSEPELEQLSHDLALSAKKVKKKK